MSETYPKSFALCGKWRRLVAERTIDFVSVPGSLKPLGLCTLCFEFDDPWPEGLDGDEVFLVIDGVLAHASIQINGWNAGNALPFAPYRFALPAGLLRSKGNEIAVELRDIIETFGPMPGRLYGTGIHREIRLERRPAASIESFAFRTELSPDWTQAKCYLEAAVRGSSDERLCATLTERATGRIVTEAHSRAGSTLTFDVAWPRLWSPERPELYDIDVRLTGAKTDTVRDIVGFRQLETRGRDFFLNGERLLIKGVCRHEFTSRHGYAPPLEAVHRELAMIKHAGFNYIRLVHSPHAPIVPRIAAELGLFVSQEPGTCWHDLSLPEVADQACDVLCRTVVRDRNLPNILAWYLSNECEPCIPYALQASRRCRAVDSVNMVTTVSATLDDEAIREMTKAADLSFYGINLYSIESGPYVKRMAAFQDRPLIFTEWGGTYHHNSPQFLEDVAGAFVQHSQPTAEPRMAGFSFWAWADYEEYSRPPLAARDGWTIEGLLDAKARLRPELQMLSMTCFNMDHPELVCAPEIEILAIAPARNEPWKVVPLDGIATKQGALERIVAQGRSRFAFANPSFGRLLVDGIEFVCRDDSGQSPLLLGNDNEMIEIPVNQPVSAIAILGNVALRGGYPYNTTSSVYHADREVEAPYASLASRYELIYEDGKEAFELKHGIDMLRGNDICRWWKTAPRSPKTRPALRTVLHPSFEILRYDLWEHSLARPRKLKSVRWALADTASIQALLALSVKSAP